MSIRTIFRDRKHLYLGIILFALAIILHFLSKELLMRFLSFLGSADLSLRILIYTILLPASGLLLLFVICIFHEKFPSVYSIAGAVIGAIIALFLPYIYGWTSIVFMGYKEVEIWGFGFFLGVMPINLAIFMIVGWFVFGYWNKIR